MDTNIVSYFLRDADGGSILSRKILSTPSAHLFITVITMEEMLGGTLSYVQRVRLKPEVIGTYARFLEMFQVLQAFRVLPYSSEAERFFSDLPPESRRVGTQDCRIAAIAPTHAYTLVSANAADFRKIGGVRVEDWTAPP
ncbi:type II toxin-antitoxin system VapC family toxin [Gloeobacter morelensis]|uniref:type II toxin-antitoxin system VapC family toxin n=1 Tax=Gloeobacter morelensis TaxID=2907343 RepID=UPI00211AB957|nr:type II toxin-antitoxin system VapC family toxin [Gloeobacter morelensis]